MTTDPTPLEKEQLDHESDLALIEAKPEPQTTAPAPAWKAVLDKVEELLDEADTLAEQAATDADSAMNAADDAESYIDGVDLRDIAREAASGIEEAIESAISENIPGCAINDKVTSAKSEAEDAKENAEEAQGKIALIKARVEELEATLSTMPDLNEVARLFMEYHIAEQEARDKVIRFEGCRARLFRALGHTLKDAGYGTDPNDLVEIGVGRAGAVVNTGEPSDFEEPTFQPADSPVREPEAD